MIKNIKKLSTTNLLIVILVISLVILGAKEIYDAIQYKKTDKVVGEIVYSQSFGKDASWDRETQKFFIHVRPIGQEDGAIYLFTFTKNSTSESEFSIWIDEMPEFNVGNIVEIEYRIQDVLAVDGKEIISIKSVPMPEEGVDFSMPLVRNENYFLNVKTRGTLDVGYMYQMIRFDEYQGYLIYLIKSDHLPLEAYWIDDDVLSLMDDDIREAFRTGEFNERLRVRISNRDQEQPFVNYECIVLNKIEFLPVK
jgi:hypothetical protein